MKRRDFLRRSVLAGVGAVVGSSLWARSSRACTAAGGPGPYGPLVEPDANGLQLPAGFRSRIVARGGATVDGTSHVWHRAADGGATFKVEGGYVYVSNSEIEDGGGGVGVLRFDPAGRLLAAYSICSGTSRNCAGGATPWGTWLTCEEVPLGLVYECDPTGATKAIARPALGSFQHEAVAADPELRRLYLTEDEDDGRLYRFTPSAWGRLESGLLEVATVEEGRVAWSRVPDPNPVPPGAETRLQVPGSTPFEGGEGIVWQNGLVHFTTKEDDRVWRYDPRAESLAVFYDAALDPERQLTGVDNVTASPFGDLVVAEDPGNLELVLLAPDCTASALVRVTGQSDTELTGPAFDPSGERLYFSSQRAEGGGITYEVTGAFSARSFARSSARSSASRRDGRS